MPFSDSSAFPPIVIVDDDEDAIFIIRRLLEKSGATHPIQSFNDSADALAFLRATVAAPLAPLLFLLDIKMPKLHGFVLLKWIRHQADFDGMTVAMLSGSDEQSDRLRAEKLGADRYLLKYPTPTAMKEVLDGAVVKAARYIRSAALSAVG